MPTFLESCTAILTLYPYLAEKENRIEKLTLLYILAIRKMEVLTATVEKKKNLKQR